MRTMAFRDWEFRKGRNCTVRLGTKWKSLIINGRIKIIDVPGNWHIMFVRVKKIIACPFDMLETKDIRSYHSSKIKTIKGLYKLMKGIYEKEFGPFRIVTVIYFDVKEEIIGE